MRPRAIPTGAPARARAAPSTTPPSDRARAAGPRGSVRTGSARRRRRPPGAEACDARSPLPDEVERTGDAAELVVRSTRHGHKLEAFGCKKQARVVGSADCGSRREEDDLSTGVQTKVGTFIWHENHSTDVEKAKSFYTELLGWQTEAWSGEMDYTLIKVGEKGHGGFMAAQGETPSHWLGHVLVE